LFIWTKLRAAELDTIEALGVQVFRSVPRQRGFNQPCPLWQGECTIYHSGHYPRFCGTYKCSLLKQVLEDSIPLPEAMHLITQAKDLIRELESLLPDSANPNFRERLSALLESPESRLRANTERWQKAEALLAIYDEVFGVTDLAVQNPQE
jgi:hypothetical protein